VNINRFANERCVEQEAIGMKESDTKDSPHHAVVSLIRGRLEEHPHFRGRVALLQIEKVGESIVLSGRLPSYYLKQLLQEAVKGIPDVASIDNRVDVVWPTCGQ
jgi:hypothetical protein